MNLPASDEDPPGKRSASDCAPPASALRVEHSFPEMSPYQDSNDQQVPGAGPPLPQHSSQSDFVLPREFGRYRLLKLLGGGGMGQVYLAHDSKLDINVALKIPRPDIIAEPRMQARFYREARTAARLVHSGLCWVLDVGEFDSTHYLVMRYVQGSTAVRTHGSYANRGRGNGARHRPRHGRGPQGGCHPP